MKNRKYSQFCIKFFIVGTLILGSFSPALNLALASSQTEPITVEVSIDNFQHFFRNAEKIFRIPKEQIYGLLILPRNSFYANQYHEPLSGSVIETISAGWNFITIDIANVKKAEFPLISLKFDFQKDLISSANDILATSLTGIIQLLPEPRFENNDSRLSFRRNFISEWRSIIIASVSNLFSSADKNLASVLDTLRARLINEREKQEADVSQKPTVVPSSRTLIVPPAAPIRGAPLITINENTINSRFQNFERELTRVRELIGRQSDSSSRSLANVVSNAITNITSGAVPESNNVWTGAQTFANASTTLQDITFVSATGTSATTTSLYVSDLASTTALRANTATIGSLTVASCAGCGGGGGFPWPFTKQADNSQGTTTVMSLLGGFYSSASSTLTSLLFSTATGTSATTTNLHVSSLASTTEFRSNVANIGSLTVASCTGCGGGGSFAFPFTKQGDGAHATSTLMEFFGGIYTNASSTLASTTATTFLSLHSTSTNLYVSNLASTTALRSNTGIFGFLTTGNLLANSSSTFQALFSTSATSTNLYATNFLALGSSTLQAFRGTSGTTTNFYTDNLLVTASSTLQNFTAASSTVHSNFLTSNATSTNLFISRLASTTEFRSNVADIGNLTVTSCTGCGSASMSFSWPFTKLGTNEQSTSTTLVFGNGFVSSASSTLSSFIATSATTTSATSTDFHISSKFNFGGIAGNSWDDFCASITGSVSLCDGSDDGGGGGIAWPFTKLGTNEQATSTIIVFLGGLLSTGSTTINTLLSNTATTTSATTTSFAVSSITSSLLKTSSIGNLVAAAAGTDYEVGLTAGDGLTRTSNDFDCDTASGSAFGCLSSADWTTFNNKLSSIPFAWPWTKQADGSHATSTLASFFGGIYTNASSTLASTTATTFLSLHATSTNLFVSRLASTTDFRANTANIGSLDVGDSGSSGDAIFQLGGDSNAWSLGYFSTDKTFRIASSTNLSANAMFQIGKSGTTTLNAGLSVESGSDDVLCIDPTTFEITLGGASCAASSLRYKEKIEELPYGLETVLQMKPVSYEYIESERPGSDIRYLGFIAEELFGIVPEVIEFDAKGLPGGIDYAKMAPVWAKAIQDINRNIQSIASATATTTPEAQTFAEGFFARLRSWFADASNGITDFFANRVRTKEICLSDESGSETCITKAQLDALLIGTVYIGASGGSSPAPVPEPESDTGPESGPVPEVAPEPTPEPGLGAISEPESPPPAEPVPEIIAEE